MIIFFLVWFGQLISMVGSGLTGFALGIWVYQSTGIITDFALIFLFAELPGTIIAPIAGAIADRYDRRWVMIFSNLGSGICTLVIVLLLFVGKLQIWHIYLATAINSTCKSFLQYAYFASTTLLVPKQHFGRAAGMIQMGKAAEQLFSPILAGLLVAVIQVWGVIFVDFISFVFATVSLLIVRFPQPEKSKDSKLNKGSLWTEVVYGWKYIATRPGLLTMIFFFAINNFSIGIAKVLMTPLLLSFTDTKVLGIVMSLGGSGWLFGSIAMTIWGGMKRRVNGIFIFEFLLGFAILIMGLRPEPILITIAAFIGFFSMPIIIGSSHTIWQNKVAPDLQGRVFAMRGMISWLSFPLAYLCAGPLADKVFEPIMVKGSFLANSLGNIIGVGSGRGIGLLFIVMGFLMMTITIVAYRYPRLRLVEDELPDV
jgi:MFS transporter, DHA3 family, macrolide efflux protein